MCLSKVFLRCTKCNALLDTAKMRDLSRYRWVIDAWFHHCDDGSWNKTEQTP